MKRYSESHRYKPVGSVWPKGDMDYLLLALTLLLTMIGCFFQFDFAGGGNEFTVGPPYYHFSRQVLFSCMGVMVMLILSKIDFRRLRSLTFPVYLVAIAAFVILMLNDDCPEYRTPFLKLGPINLNASLFLAFAASMQLVNFLSSEKKLSISGNLAFIFLYVFLPLILIMAFFDLGTAIVFGIASAALLFLLYPKSTMIGISGHCLFSFYMFSKFNFLSKRIETWRNPFMDPLGYGYEVIQSMYAIASGGLLGTGIGNGQAKVALPSIFDHYVLAGITHEVGIMGVTIILLIFVALLLCILRIAIRCPDRFGFLFASMVIAKISVQLVCQLAIVTNMLPPGGVSIPFLSFSDSSMLFDFCFVGILLNISRYRGEKNVVY